MRDLATLTGQNTLSLYISWTSCGSFWPSLHFLLETGIQLEVVGTLGPSGAHFMHDLA